MESNIDCSPTSSEADKENTVVYFTPRSRFSNDPDKTQLETRNSVPQPQPTSPSSSTKVFELRGNPSLLLCPHASKNAAFISTPVASVLLDGCDSPSHLQKLCDKLHSIDVVLVAGTQTVDNNSFGRYLENAVNGGTLIHSMVGLPGHGEFVNLKKSLAEKNVYFPSVSQADREHGFGKINLASNLGVGSLDLIVLNVSATPSNDGYILIWTSTDKPNEPIRLLFPHDVSSHRILAGIQDLMTTNSSSVFSGWKSTGTTTSATESSERVSIASHGSGPVSSAAVRPARSLDKPVHAEPHKFKLTRERSVLRKNALANPVPAAGRAVSPRLHPPTTRPVPVPVQPGPVKPAGRERKVNIPAASQPIRSARLPGADLSKAIPKARVEPVSVVTRNPAAAPGRSGPLKATAPIPTTTKKISAVPQIPAHFDATFIPHDTSGYLTSEAFFNVVRSKTYIFACSSINPSTALGLLIQGKKAWESDEVTAIVMGQPVEEPLVSELARVKIHVEMLSNDHSMFWPEDPTPYNLAQLEL